MIVNGKFDCVVLLVLVGFDSYGCLLCILMEYVLVVLFV